MNVISKKLIIFDFDGVLANTLAIILNNAKQASESLGFEKLPQEKHIRMLRKMEFDELGISLGITNEKIPAFVDLMLKFSADNIPNIFPDIKMMLEKIQMNILCINTGNSLEAVTSFLESNDITHYFDKIMDKKTGMTKKDRIETLIESYHIHRSNTYMIGDALSDIEAAQQAGVKSIAVSWGNQDYEMLMKSQPDYIVDTPTDIIKIVGNPI